MDDDDDDDEEECDACLRHTSCGDCKADSDEYSHCEVCQLDDQWPSCRNFTTGTCEDDDGIQHWQEQPCDGDNDNDDDDDDDDDDYDYYNDYIESGLECTSRFDWAAVCGSWSEVFWRIAHFPTMLFQGENEVCENRDCIRDSCKCNCTYQFTCLNDPDYAEGTGGRRSFSCCGCNNTLLTSLNANNSCGFMMPYFCPLGVATLRLKEIDGFVRNRAPNVTYTQICPYENCLEPVTYAEFNNSDCEGPRGEFGCYSGNPDRPVSSWRSCAYWNETEEEPESEWDPEDGSIDPATLRHTSCWDLAEEYNCEGEGNFFVEETPDEGCIAEELPVDFFPFYYVR